MSKNKTFPTVPLKEVPAQDEGKSEGHRPVVLVVDDESVIADTLAEILTRSGYKAVPVYDADSALETALLTPPEMLITDVVLPGMTGIELAITVRRIFPDCKIILFSGQASTADLLASARAEGHHFTLLNKPLHPQDLLARVSDGLKPRKPASVEMK
ncbi:MAG TPA: response regulator [Terracidiphilus sp.]|nr:response regulator [Terracidiphilus sp.]